MAVVSYPSDILPLPVGGGSEAQADVVVAGSGPTGLLLGCLLRQAGIDVVIVDPHVLPGEGSKASVTQPRSMEQMELANVNPKTFESAQPLEAARICLGGGTWTAEAHGFLRNVTEKSRHQARTLGQNYVEKALSERYAELGGRVYRAARFVSYVDRGSFLDVEVERSAYMRPPATLEKMPAWLAAVKKTTFRAKFIVGCDGKQSAVRKAIGADYIGEDYSEVFLLADVDIPDDEIQAKGFHLHPFHVLNDATSGSVILWVHLQGQRWRTYFCQKGLTRDHCQREFIEGQWQNLFPAPGPPSPHKVHFVDLAYFEVSCRLTSSYQKGRVLLAGDAAHCHSPAGGQGMNMGLQDAANLAWKLAAVLKEQAPQRLLNSYEPERRPIAEWVLGGSDVMFRSLTTQTSTAFAVARRLALKGLFAVVPASKIPPAFFVSKMLGLTHTYGDCGTCADTGCAPARGCFRAGDRMMDLPCREAGVEGEVCTLELLKTAPHTALRIFLIAETSSQQPETSEVEACLRELRPLIGQGLPVQPVLYTATISRGGSFRSRACLAGDSQRSTVFAPSALSTEVTKGFEMIRSLSPADADAAKEPVCAELCTRLGLSRGGRALLVVRPDGYVAVRHVGSWVVAPVRAALHRIGLGPVALAAL